MNTNQGISIDEVAHINFEKDIMITRLRKQIDYLQAKIDEFHAGEEANKKEVKRDEPAK
jgi:uncharacterized coiled-coil protein SlyX